MVRNRISYPDPGADFKFGTDLVPDPVFSTAESGPRFFLYSVGSGSGQFQAGSTTPSSEVYANMVLISVGNSEHVAHAWRKIDLFGEKNPNCDVSRSNQIPYSDQITEIDLYVRTYFWVTIWNKYHDAHI